MAYATRVLPSLEEAIEVMKFKQLATWSSDNVLVGTGEYVVDFNEERAPAILSLILHGYTLDFSTSFVKLVP